MCKMGTAHFGEENITLASFSGDNNEEKQKVIDELVRIGTLKAVPLTKEEELALVKVLEQKAYQEKADLKQKEADAAKVKSFLEADFDSMNKEPMIEFAKENKINLKNTKAEEIRMELKSFQDSLKSSEDK